MIFEASICELMNRHFRTFCFHYTCKQFYVKKPFITFQTMKLYFMTNQL